MDKKLIGLISIFFLVFGVFITVLLFNDSLATITKAKDELVPTTEKTIVFAFPLSLKADGGSSSQVTVWVRNKDGKGIPNQRVDISTNLGVFNESSLNSDGQGRAVFLLSSTTPGIADIDATVANSIKPSNKVSIRFTQ